MHCILASTSKIIYEATLKTYLEMLREDSYYAWYNRYGTNYGTDETYYRGDTTDEPHCAFDKYVNELTIEDIKQAADMGRWKTSAGNVLYFQWNHKAQSVRIIAKGRRHGIPWRGLDKVLKEHPNDWEILEYETQQPTWAPWETLDDYSEAV